MRLSYAMELVLAAGVGMALTRYRLTDPDHVELFAQLQWIVRLEDGIDSFFAGVALVGGLGTLVERARGKSPAVWGPGRWAWLFVASYLVLHLLVPLCGEISAHLGAVGANQATLIQDVLAGIRWRYSGFLLTPVSWSLLALALTSLAARPGRDPHPDGREWAGRAFAALLVFTGLALKGLILLGYQAASMGGCIM